MTQVKNLRDLASDFCAALELRQYQKASKLSFELAEQLYGKNEKIDYQRADNDDDDTHHQQKHNQRKQANKANEDYDDNNNNNEVPNFVTYHLKQLADCVAFRLQATGAALAAYADVEKFVCLQDLGALRRAIRFKQKFVGHGKCLDFVPNYEQLATVFRRATFLLKSVSAVATTTIITNNNAKLNSSALIDYRKCISSAKIELHSIDDENQGVNNANATTNDNKSLTNVLRKLNAGFENFKSQASDENNDWLLNFALKLNETCDDSNKNVHQLLLPANSRATILVSLLAIADFCENVKLAQLGDESLRRTCSIGQAAFSAFELSVAASSCSPGSAWLAYKRAQIGTLKNKQLQVESENENENDDDEDDFIDSYDNDDDESKSASLSLSSIASSSVGSYLHNNLHDNVDSITKLKKLLNDETSGRIKCTSCGTLFSQTSQVPISCAKCNKCNQKIFVCSASFARIPLADLSSIKNCLDKRCEEFALVSDVKWARSMIKQLPQKVTQLLFDDLNDNDSQEDEKNKDNKRKEEDETIVEDGNSKYERMRIRRNESASSQSESESETSQSSSSVIASLASSTASLNNANEQFKNETNQLSAEKSQQTLDEFWKKRFLSGRRIRVEDFMYSESELMIQFAMQQSLIGNSLPMRAADFVVIQKQQNDNDDIDENDFDKGINENANNCLPKLVEICLCADRYLAANISKLLLYCDNNYKEKQHSNRNTFPGCGSLFYHSEQLCKQEKSADTTRVMFQMQCPNCSLPLRKVHSLLAVATGNSTI